MLEKAGGHFLGQELFSLHILCDFRCGSYRVLGDILMDLDKQYRIAEIQKHKGVNRNDSEQLQTMLLDFTGFQRILIILARGYLFRDGGSGCDRIEVARRALLAWCSLSMEKMKKAPDQNDPRLRVNYGEYAAECARRSSPRRRRSRRAFAPGG